MHEKNLSSIYKRFSYISPLVSKCIHINCRNITKSAQNYTDLDGFSPTIVEPFVGRFSSLLQACSDASVLRQGHQVHAQIIVNGISDKTFLGTRILGMYVLCKSFIDAKNMFFRLEWRYASPWNWMIRGFTIMGCHESALLFYIKMLGCGTSPDKYTFPYVIKACGGLSAVNVGRWIHETIRFMGFEMDVFVGSSLIKFYAENDSIYDARCLFEKIPHKDSVLWNVMLNGYVRTGDSDKALEVFSTMRNTEMKPNSVTFACILSICASEAMIEYGTQLHGLVIRCGLDIDSPVANTLLAMYAKCRCLPDARKLFDTMPRTDLVTWNGMISGYVQNGFIGEAWYMFNEMLSAGVKPDSITFASFLPSVSEFAGLKQVQGC